jgi:hypothetical protein
MRISYTSIKSAIVSVTLAALVGCAMPSWHGGTKSKTDASNLANAPPAPSFNPASPQAPTVTMPPAGQTASSMPTYPGTNYPVTPYPASQPAVAAPTAYTAAPAATAGYASGMTPGVANSLAAQAAPTAPATSPYGQPQASPYAQPQASPYASPAPPMGTYNAATPSATYTR